ncbi:MAG: hypothetical protein GWN31_17345 [Candidatus Thorarchaeota archaeon]|nr:hypothetical protein [Candidatus Thorarchaeota archaeon]
MVYVSAMALSDLNFPHIQVALDPPLSIEALCELAKKVSKGGSRLIEAGTPPLKLHGLTHLLPALKKAVPDAVLVADMKTMDVGDLEAKIAFDNGADIVSVLAIGGDKKIEEAVKVAKNRGKDIYIDLIDVGEPLSRIREIKRHILSPLNKSAIFLLHRGISQQRKESKGIYEEKHLISQVATDLKNHYLAIAGGLKREEVKELSQFADILIVGSTITSSSQPQKMTRQLFQEIQAGS